MNTMNTMTYKNLTARVEFDERDNIFVGRVLGVRDIIGFHGETVAELTNDFHNAVDLYLKECEESGKNPMRQAGGKLMLRVPPEVHSAAIIAAQAAGTSLNQWAANVLAKAAHAG
jgi:predicted HicB family RNase H-like nuclease